MTTERQPTSDQVTPQYSIGKYSIGKYSKDKLMLLHQDSTNNIYSDGEQNFSVGEGGENPFFKKAKEAFGEMSINATITDDLNDLIKTYGGELVLYALDLTILNGGRSIKYTRSILNRWQGEGVKTVEQAKQNVEAFERRKNIRHNQSDNVPFSELGEDEELGF